MDAGLLTTTYGLLSICTWGSYLASFAVFFHSHPCCESVTLLQPNMLPHGTWWFLWRCAYRRHPHCHAALRAGVYLGSLDGGVTTLHTCSDVPKDDGFVLFNG